MWAYGVHQCGAAKPSNIHKIRCLLSKIFSKIIKAPFQVSNQTIDSDLEVPFLRDYRTDRLKLKTFIPFNVQSLHNSGNPTRLLGWPCLYYSVAISPGPTMCRCQQYYIFGEIKQYIPLIPGLRSAHFLVTLS